MIFKHHVIDRHKFEQEIKKRKINSRFEILDL